MVGLNSVLFIAVGGWWELHGQGFTAFHGVVHYVGVWRSSRLLPGQGFTAFHGVVHHVAVWRSSRLLPGQGFTAIC